MEAVFFDAITFVGIHAGSALTADTPAELVDGDIIFFCGIRLLLYRRRDRGVVALEDACWHRLLPLSHGRLEGDEIVISRNA